MLRLSAKAVTADLRGAKAVTADLRDAKVEC